MNTDWPPIKSARSPATKCTTPVRSLWVLTERDVPFENPNGILALSPAVARNELPWVIVPKTIIYPNGVASFRFARLMKPRWGFGFFRRQPRVAPRQSGSDQPWAE
jgi:hypothetical protein